MTKILSTIGPVSGHKNLNKLLNKSDFIRLNMSHNTFDWHKSMIDKIKKLDKNKLILVDIPGVKPRTLNGDDIKISKGQKVSFSYNNKSKKNIHLSNPLPKIELQPKTFSLSDGSFEFKFNSFKNETLTGISLQDFILKPKKGLNVPFSKYNNFLQEKVYISFLKKIKSLKFDFVGLSFIQDSKVLKKLKKKYPEKLFISKIENFLGYKNRKEIIRYSDAVMIDRGDLAAEVGLSNLTDYSDRIMNDCNLFGKPVIIATENLNSLMTDKIPSKGDVTNLDYYISKNADFLMLSDETATSKNWLNTLNWLDTYLKKKLKNFKATSAISIEDTIKNFKDQTLVVFSKKGYFFKKISSLKFRKLIFFTENEKLAKVIRLKKNFTSYVVKYPKKSIDIFLYKNIKKNLKNIFDKNINAYLINVIFPRKNSRANSISIIEKKDFFK